MIDAVGKRKTIFAYATVLVCLAYRIVAADSGTIQFNTTTTTQVVSELNISSVASLPDAHSPLIAGHKFSFIPKKNKTPGLENFCLASFSSEVLGNTRCAMRLKDDKDIYEDIKSTDKNSLYETTVSVARSKSYILLGMAGLPLQKLNDAGVAYFYEIIDGDNVKFMRSFNVTPDKNTNTGKFVAIGENYAAVYQKESKHAYIHTFINTYGEWRDYDKLKIDMASNSNVLGITMSGFNLRVFTSSVTNNVILYEFRNGWKKAGYSTLSLPEPVLFSSRGDDTLVFSGNNHTLNYSGKAHGYTVATLNIKDVIGVSYGYQNTSVYSYGGKNLTISRGIINTRQNQNFIAEAFFETTQNSEFNAKLLTDQIMISNPKSICVPYLDYFKQHYFRVYVSLGYVCEDSSNPLSHDITAAYENLRKQDLLLISFDGSQWKLPSDYSSFHDQGKRMSGLILGYIAIGMAGPVVVLSFFWAILGFCIPSLRPKNRNRAPNSEATGFIPPQA